MLLYQLYISYNNTKLRLKFNDYEISVASLVL